MSNVNTCFHTSPWVLTVDFDKQIHLFRGKLETNYKINAYSCICGHTEMIIRKQSKSIKYVCSECGNNFFNNANTILKDLKKIKKSRQIKADFNIVHYNGRAVSKKSFKILNNINFLRNKFEYREVVLFEVSIDINGNIYRNYSSVFALNSETIEKKLIRYIKYNNVFPIPEKGRIFNSLDRISHSIKNKLLLTGEFKLSNRKEKSILKTIYQEYDKLQNNNRDLYLNYIDVITETIRDPNLVCRLLKISISKNIICLFYKNKMNFMNTIMMLKSYSYTEKQIVNLLNRSTSDDYMFSDLVHELEYIRERNILGFKKVSCNLKALHDEAVRYAKKLRSNIKLQYTVNQTKPCIPLENYTIRLPHNGEELIKWSKYLDNCLAGYLDVIQYTETIVYGFFKDNTLIFAVEIYNGKLSQSSSKNNTPLNKEEKDIQELWLKKFFYTPKVYSNHLS